MNQNTQSSRERNSADICEGGAATVNVADIVVVTHHWHTPIYTGTSHEIDLKGAGIHKIINRKVIHTKKPTEAE